MHGIMNIKLHKKSHSRVRWHVSRLKMYKKHHEIKLRRFDINIWNLFDFMFQLNAPFLYYIYHIPLHFSSNIMLIIRRIHCTHTASGSLYVTLLRWLLSAQAGRGMINVINVIKKLCIKLEYEIKYYQNARSTTHKNLKFNDVCSVRIN